VSVVSIPGKKDWYTFRYMTLISGRFRKAIRKIVGRKLYCRTVMNSLCPSVEELWNFGDVVVELKDGFQATENWTSIKHDVARTIRDFEKTYPGLNFSITRKDNGLNLVLMNAARYRYPEKAEPIFVFEVDPLVSWF
jgi:hypothetical protein